MKYLWLYAEQRLLPRVSNITPLTPLVSPRDRIWRRFAEGYASLKGAERDRDLVIGHSVGWVLWVAEHSRKMGHPKRWFYARSAFTVRSDLRVEHLLMEATA